MKRVAKHWGRQYTTRQLLRQRRALGWSAADEQGRAQVAELAARVQSEIDETVEIAYVDQVPAYFSD